MHAELLPRYGFDESGTTLDLRSHFDEGLRLCLEIGSGNGDLSSYVARHRSDVAVVAIDVHRPGIARLLDDIRTHELTNLRVVEGDAMPFVERLMPNSIDELWIFFPDPWPKNAQAHRRLVSDERVRRLARVIRTGGVLRLATDVSSYAVMSRAVIDRSGLFEPATSERPEWRIETAFERAGRSAGRDSIDLAAVRNSSTVA